MRAANPCAARLSAQRGRLPHRQAQLPSIMLRPDRLPWGTHLRSVAAERLAELTGRGVLDAEAVAAALAVEGKEQLTAAWSQLPSRLLGQRHGQMTYEEGMRLYISQGAAMQHAAANRGQAEGSSSNMRPLRVAVASVGGDAGGGGAVAHELLSRRGLVTTDQRLYSAVEAAMQHLPDVESHLEPEALARALSNATTSKAAVHVAALADAAWRQVPSKVLGPRPGWLAAYPDQSIREWRYGDLLQLAAAVGFERVKRALAQPCMELARLELHPHAKEERLKLDAAIENVERISGVSFPTLLERWSGRSGLAAMRARLAGPGCSWVSGLDAVGVFKTSSNGIPLSTNWSQAPAAGEGELLQLCIQDGSGARAVEFTPPRLLHPPARVSVYGFPVNISEALLPWAEVRRSRDLFVKGWGAFPVSLDPPLDGGYLPTPAQVRARGYAAELFPRADSYAAQRIRRILSDPASAQLAQYIVKWRCRLNGPLAARLDKLETVALGEQEFDLPPETLLRRLEQAQEQARVKQAVPYEQFGWLAAAGHPATVTAMDPAAHPRILTSKTGSDGAELNVLLLTTSHQIAMAGFALKNCVGRSLLDRHISHVRGRAEMLLVLCPGTDVQEAKAMASWTGGWSQIYESCNVPIRSEWKDMFLHAEVEVRRIWDSDGVRIQRTTLKRFYGKLMSWDDPRVAAALTGSDISKQTFAAGLASVLAAVGVGEPVQGSRLAKLLVSGTGCSKLFYQRQYCGFSSLKSFIAALPLLALWDSDGYVRFHFY